MLVPFGWIFKDILSFLYASFEKKKKNKKKKTEVLWHGAIRPSTFLYAS